MRRGGAFWLLAAPAERGEETMETRTSLGLSPRLTAVRETLAEVAGILPEREAGPLQDGAAWALGHYGETVISEKEAIDQGFVGNAGQAEIFVGAAKLIRDQFNRDRVEQERVVKKAISRGGSLQVDR